MLDKVIEKIGLATYGGTDFDLTGEYREKLTNILVSFLNYSSAEMYNFYVCNKCKKVSVCNKPTVYVNCPCGEPFTTEDRAFPNFHQTIIHSKEWQAWEKEIKRRFDIRDFSFNNIFDTDESRECDMFSPQHWKAFVEFIRSKK